MKYYPIYVNSAYVDLFYFHYFVTYRCNKGNIKTCLGFNKNMISGFGVYLYSCDVQDTQQKNSLRYIMNHDNVLYLS